MEFNYIADGIDAVVIDNFYTKEQLDEIHTELKWLTKPAIMQKPGALSSATNADGDSVTYKSGVFLEQVFKNWEHSAIIKHGITQMDTPLFKSSLLSFNSLFKTIDSCNSRTHLVSYYENAGYYKPHIDHAVFTVLNYFNVEPKQFEGGDIVLYSCNSDKKATVEVKDNRTVIIASTTLHEVTEVKSKLNDTLSGNGRYCSSIFLLMANNRDTK